MNETLSRKLSKLENTRNKEVATQLYDAIKGLKEQIDLNKTSCPIWVIDGIDDAMYKYEQTIGSVK